MRRAFTLIELLAVVGILASFVTPSASSLPRVNDGPPSVKPPASPSAEVLLKRVLEAHRDLGPCYVEQTSGGDIPRSSTHRWMRWNDSRHFVESEDIEQTEFIVTLMDGRHVVTYDTLPKTYVRLEVASDGNDPKIFNFLLSLETALHRPEERLKLARVTVMPISYQGIPCYKIHWDPLSPSTGPPVIGAGGGYMAPFRTLIVGRRDWLVRKITRDYFGEGLFVDLLTYQFRKQPYPESMFVFVPPPGAREDTERGASE